MKRDLDNNDEWTPPSQPETKVKRVKESKRKQKAKRAHSKKQSIDKRISIDTAYKRAEAITKSDLNSRKALHRYLVAVYRIAFEAKVDEELFEKIYSDARWKGVDNPPQPEDRGNLMPHVFKLTMPGDKRARQQRSSDYNTGLADAWRNEVDPAALLELIKSEGGIEAMKERERKRRNQLKKGTATLTISAKPKRPPELGDSVKVYGELIERDGDTYTIRPHKIVPTKAD